MKRATHTMMREDFWWGQMRRGPTGFPSRNDRRRARSEGGRDLNSETARLRQAGHLACSRKESKIFTGSGCGFPAETLLF